MFFKWLRVARGVAVSPSEFLSRVAVSKGSVNPVERLWGRNLLLEFTRDNPDFKERGRIMKYNLFSAVKLFCDYHEVPVTSSVGVFGKSKGRKFDDPPFTVERALKVLGILSQRDRAICMCMLQSGQSIKQILVPMNGMADYVFKEIDAGKERIRIDFRERKGNVTPYYTYIAHDAIQELQKMRVIRQKTLQAKGIAHCKWLFITEDCEPVKPYCFEIQFRELCRRHGLWTGPYSVRLHGFRQFFEQEASPPDRGVSRHYVSFMMGHVSEEGLNKHDVVGGVYDKRPSFDSRTVENEYGKLEPWLNVFSNRAVVGSSLSEEQQRGFEDLARFLDENPAKRERFMTFLKEL
jgi:integrase